MRHIEAHFSRRVFAQSREVESCSNDVTHQNPSNATSVFGRACSLRPPCLPSDMSTSSTIGTRTFSTSAQFQLRALSCLTSIARGLLLLMSPAPGPGSRTSLMVRRSSPDRQVLEIHCERLLRNSRHHLCTLQRFC